MFAGLFPFTLRLVVALAAIAGVCAEVRGDEAAISEILVLSNGDRVSGVSIGTEAGALRWRMPYGRELLIPLELVERIETVTDALDEVAGEAIEDPEPPTPAPDPPKEEAPKEAAPKKDSEVQPASSEAPAVVTDPPPLTKAWYDAARSTYSYAGNQTGRWTKRFEFGGTWVDGNSETSEIYVGGVFERQFEKVSHQLDWNGRRATAGEQVTQSRWQFNGNTDFSRQKDSKWILFTNHRHTFDELADLDYRGSFASGIGYRFLNEGDKRFILRLGPGGTVEKYGEPLGTRVTPDLFGEAEAKWPILDRTLLEYKSTVTPSLSDISVFRATSNYGVLVKLDEKEAWAMRLGLLHNYNSTPNDNTKRNDFTTTFSVVYSRK